MFRATKKSVFNRGAPPDVFLTELLKFGRTAPDEIFAPNSLPVDIFTVIKSSLATMAGHDGAGTPIYTWESLQHRRAALLEAMRVHGMFESSGNFNEGVDITNQHSQAHIEGAETGIFQVSFDSTWLGHQAMKPFAVAHKIETPQKFIPAMKQNHPLALEYYARLVRISVQWAGPLLRHGADSIYPYLSRDAMNEFKLLLAAS
jgi:hypothetical protein